MKTLFLALLSFSALASADNWLTFAGNNQRTGWAKGETDITVENVAKLGVQWSIKLENDSKELNGLTVPVIVEHLTTPRGFKEYAVVAGSSDTAFAIDLDDGKIVWRKKFQVEGSPKGAGHWLCPNALNATPVIETGPPTVHILASDGKLHSLNVIDGEDRKPPIQFVPPFSKNWSLSLNKGILYTTISQGCNGAKSGVYAMNLKDPNRPVSFFQDSTAGAGIWGRAGGAISNTTGLLYAESGDGPYDVANGKYSDTIMGISPDMKLADYYTPQNRAYITKKDLDMGNISPVVFPFDKWELVAGAGKEGVIYLLDSKSLGGADHRTPLYRSPLLANDDVDFAGRGFWGAMATWQDPQGTTWLYAPAWGPPSKQAPPFPISYGPAPSGSIMAFKLAVKEGKPSLVPAWISRDMHVPEPPIIANGIVFSIANGENVRQVDTSGRILTSKERAATPVGNTTLYAFDAATGKQLFSSGKTIPGFSHFSGLAISGGRIFVETYDGMLYAFGLPQ